MEVVFYFDKDMKYCPVKKYLENYNINSKDNIKEHKRKLKILSEIDRKINFIKNNNGRAKPPIAKTLRGFDFFEIRTRKSKITLIRILYFCHKNIMVLLNAFEKPSIYNPKKLNKKIDKNLEITNIFKNKFISNPKSYEKYE